MKHGTFNMILKVNVKVCSRHLHDPRKLACQKSQTDTTLITFFDINAIVHFEFVPQGQAYDVEIMEWLREAVHRKGAELRPIDWILHHDNAPAHKAMSSRQFLTLM